jgi:ribosomal protein S18 acetylase RimI-like enzyme
LAYVVALQKRFTDQLGFMPRAALVEWIERRTVHVVEENGDPAGYILARERVNSARWCRPLTQVAVAMDAQRRRLGFALLRRVADLAKTELLEGLQCWVAQDIEAVDFFNAAGFIHVATRKPENARRRPLMLFRAALQHFEPGDFWTAPAVAGCRPSRIPGTPAAPLFTARRQPPKPQLLG